MFSRINLTKLRKGIFMKQVLSMVCISGLIVSTTSLCMLPDQKAALWDVISHDDIDRTKVISYSNKLIFHDVQDDRGQHPLHKAAQIQTAVILNFFLGHQKSFDSVNKYEIPQRMLALAMATRDRVGSASPAHTLSQLPLQLIFSYAHWSINLNSQDYDGNTALHLASMKGLAKNIEALLKAGADRAIKNNLGLTPQEVATGNAVTAFSQQ